MCNNELTGKFQIVSYLYQDESPLPELERDQEEEKLTEE
jgi:hypothetical protein